MAQKILGIMSINNKKIVELQADPTIDTTGLTNLEQGSIAIYQNKIYVKDSIKGAAPSFSSLATGGAAWALSGNALSGGEKLGSSNALPLTLIANNLTQMEFDATGTNITLHQNITPSLDLTTDIGSSSKRLFRVYSAFVDSGNVNLTLRSNNASAYISSGTGPVGITAETLGANITYNFTGLGLNMATKNVSNMADPVSAQDATTKNYVDTAVNALVNSLRFREFATVISGDDLSAVVDSSTLASVLPFTDDDGGNIVEADFVAGSYFISNAKDSVNGSLLWKVFDDLGTLKITKVGVTQPADTYAYHVKYNLLNTPNALEKRAIFVASNNAGIVTMIKVADETFSGATGIQLLANTPIDTLGGVVNGTNPIATTDTVDEAIRKLIFDVNSIGPISPKWSIGGDDFGVVTSSSIGTTSDTDIVVVRNNLDKMTFGLSQTTTTNDLVPSVNNSLHLGSATKRFDTLFLSKTISLVSSDSLKHGIIDVTNASGLLLKTLNVGNDISLVTADNGTLAATNTGAIKITSGSNTQTGNSGNVELKTGTALSGTRGIILLNAQYVDVNSTQVKNVANPTAPQDAVTKNYLEGTSWLLGGNALAATSNIGSTTNFDVNIIRNSASRIVIAANDTSLLTSLTGKASISVGDSSATLGTLESITMFANPNTTSASGFDEFMMSYAALGKSLRIVTGNNTAADALNTSQIWISTGDISNGSGSGKTGDMVISSGNHLGTSDSGAVIIASGKSTIANAGNVYIQTGIVSPILGADHNKSGEVFVRTTKLNLFARAEMNFVVHGGLNSEDVVVIQSKDDNHNSFGSSLDSLLIHASDNNLATTTSKGGDLSLRGGNSLVPTGSKGGDVLIDGGSSSNSQGGIVQISAGNTGDGTKQGASVILIGGSTTSTTQKGGDVYVKGGTDGNNGIGNLYIDNSDVLHAYADGSLSGLGIAQKRETYNPSLTNIKGEVYPIFLEALDFNYQMALGYATADTTSVKSGSIHLHTGDSSAAASGDIFIETGSASTVRGDVWFQAKAMVYTSDDTNKLSITDNTSAFVISGNNTTSTIASRDIVIQSGNSQNANAGSIYLKAGTSSIGSSSGDIALEGDFFRKQYRDGFGGTGLPIFELESAHQITTVDATQTTAITDNGLLDGKVYVYKITATAFVNGSSETNVFIRTVHVKKLGGIATVVLEQTDFTSEENINTNISTVASSGNINFTVTGIAAITVNWSIHIHRKEFTF